MMLWLHPLCELIDKICGKYPFFVSVSTGNCSDCFSFFFFYVANWTVPAGPSRWEAVIIPRCFKVLVPKTRASATSECSLFLLAVNGHPPIIVISLY